MKKAKQQASKQLTPEQYIRQKARMLPVEDCFMTSDWEKVGESIVLVVRRHVKETYTIGVYLIDTFCLGLKDSYYYFSIDKIDYDNLLERFRRNESLEKISYNEAHNMIFGAIAFAEEAGITPSNSFELTQYLLEEDTEDVPLIEYDYGKNGEHFLCANNRLELNRYLPLLDKNLGKGNYHYIVNDEDAEYKDSMDWLENMEKMMERTASIPEEKYSYCHPEYPAVIRVKNDWLVSLFYDHRNACKLSEATVQKILALPHEELRTDLEQIILYETGCTCGQISESQWNTEYASVIIHCLLLLGALGDARSLPVVLETLCQNEDYYDYHFGDIVGEIYTYVLYRLGKEHLDELFAYLQIPGLYSYARYHIFPAVALIPFYQPERRDEVIDWFRKVLVFYAGRLEKQECCDGILVGLMTKDLLDLQAKELLPELKVLYGTDLVDTGCCGEYSEIEKEMLQGGDSDFRGSVLLDINEIYKKIG